MQSYTQACANKKIAGLAKLITDNNLRQRKRLIMTATIKDTITKIYHNLFTKQRSVKIYKIQNKAEIQGGFKKIAIIIESEHISLRNLKDQDNNR